MKKIANWLKNEESGQGMVEYGLIIALMAAVIIAGIAILGPKIKAVFEGMNFGAASGG